MVSPAFSLAPSTRASARIGNASPSALSPLASAMSRPERSAFGNGLVSQPGAPPRRFGTIQIWKIRVGSDSRLYSAWRMPVAGRHHLHVAGLGPALVAEAVRRGHR